MTVAHSPKIASRERTFYVVIIYLFICLFIYFTDPLQSLYMLDTASYEREGTTGPTRRLP